jgi:D-alanine-D-alanine ligase
MKIGILFNQPASRGQKNWEASVDVLTQVDAVDTALKSLSHQTVRLPLGRNSGNVLASLQSGAVDAVFNLCETIDEDPNLSWHSAALLELLDVPFTGSPSSALMLTGNKVLTKRLLSTEGIRTPGYVVYRAGVSLDAACLEFPVIVKPQFEDASIGIDQESIFETPVRLLNGIAALERRFGPVLVEEYIAGREFNISLFGFPEATVMPLAEINFSEFPDTLYPIVGYRAKWDPSSFEYEHTPRFFNDTISDHLAAGLRRTAQTCFALFGLRDYGRVDVRVDGQGRIYVLEVNANPCLSPDAGLAAAVQQSGRDYRGLVAELTDWAVLRRPGNESSSKDDDVDLRFQRGVVYR